MGALPLERSPPRLPIKGQNYYLGHKVAEDKACAFRWIVWIGLAGTDAANHATMAVAV